MGFCCTFEADKAWRKRADKEGCVEVWNVNGHDDVVRLETDEGNVYEYDKFGNEKRC